MERDKLIDRLKGYACFLVLFGHVIRGMRNGGVEMPSVFFGIEGFIWSFHVSLFLFLSGAVYTLTGEWRGKKTKTAFIKNKLINLGVPYVVFSAVYVIINSLVPGANTQFSLYDILGIWKSPIAQYWFLYALFFLFLIWAVLSGILKNWQITAAVTVLAYALPFAGVRLGDFEVVFYSALAFGLGTFISVSKIKEIPAWLKVIIISVHLAAGMALALSGIIEYPVIKELIMIFGIYASILFISLLQEIKIFARFLDFMNRYSFQTYLLHTIFTAAVRIVICKVGITIWWIHIPAGCIIGIVCSVIAAIIAEKTKVLNICFFPTKVFKGFFKKSIDK